MAPNRAQEDTELRVRQRAITDLMPPVKHLACLLPQGFPNLLGAPPTLNHRFKVAQQMCPADLAPPRRIPRVRTPTIRHQDTTEALAQEILSHLGPTRPADRKDGDPRRDRHPQPGTGACFAPSRLIQVRDGLRADIGLGLGHGCRHGLHRRLFQMGNRPETHGKPEQVGHDVLGRALRQAIRPGAQRHHGLHARPKAPSRHPRRHVRAGESAAGGAAQPVQLILRHERLHGGHFRHLMPVWLGTLALQRVLTAMTLLRLDRDYSIHLLDGDQRPGLPRMPWLPPALASTRPPAYALPQRLWGITGRRARGVVRVLLEALQQTLDGGLQRGDARFEGADILSDGNRCVLPQLWWEGWHGVHGLRSYAAGHRLARLTHCDHVNAYSDSLRRMMFPSRSPRKFDLVLPSTPAVPLPSFPDNATIYKGL